MFRVTGFVCVLLLGLGNSLLAKNHPKTCQIEIASLQAFESQLKSDIPRCQLWHQVGPWLAKDLLAKPNLSTEAATALAANENPLFLNQEVIEAWRQAYAKMISDSKISDARKQELNAALDRAARELSQRALKLPLWNQPGPLVSVGGGEGGGAVTGGTGSAISPTILRRLKSGAFRSCLSHTTQLFIVSNLVNTGGALLAHWSDYAGKNRGALAMISPSTWTKALSDERFVHNIAWNAVMMAGLAGLTCLSNEKQGHYLLTGMGIGASLLGQAFVGGIGLRQTVVDGLFVHFITYYKAKGALWLAEQYQNRGGPAPKLVQSLIYLINEGIGSIGYPIADDFSRWACHDPINVP